MKLVLFFSHSSVCSGLRTKKCSKHLPPECLNPLYGLSWVFPIFTISVGDHTNCLKLIIIRNLEPFKSLVFRKWRFMRMCGQLVVRIFFICSQMRHFIAIWSSRWLLQQSPYKCNCLIYLAHRFLRVET